MTEHDQKQLGKTLWAIADQLRGAMNADDFRDYMLSFLFLRYLSDNYEQAAKKELGADYPQCEPDEELEELKIVNQHRKMTRVQRPKLTRVSWLISSS
ncbi:type I restriction-modification system subunit M N-terminal domain-containing protein, partial [Aeromonas caviae]|uniref:type I restriction-modification system subunit M N-terminal domain-containing protein n=1 Tax=Aeromonas caviae TaxID=648 RepID=UPI003F7420E8